MLKDKNSSNAGGHISVRSAITLGSLCGFVVLVFYSCSATNTYHSANVRFSYPKGWIVNTSLSASEQKNLVAFAGWKGGIVTEKKVNLKKDIGEVNIFVVGLVPRTRSESAAQWLDSNLGQPSWENITRGTVSAEGQLYAYAGGSGKGGSCILIVATARNDKILIFIGQLKSHGHTARTLKRMLDFAESMRPA